MKALNGHVSADTAYIVEDYPYGFRLRCQIRYWLEFKKGKGFRFCSQTTNPKRPGTVWNKPKCSTYARLGGVMLLDDTNGRVDWETVTEYDDLPKLESFLGSYGDTLPEDGRAELQKFVDIKQVYERNKARGMDYQAAARDAIIAYQIEKGKI